MCECVLLYFTERQLMSGQSASCYTKTPDTLSSRSGCGSSFIVPRIPRFVAWWLMIDSSVRLSFCFQIISRLHHSSLWWDESGLDSSSSSSTVSVGSVSRRVKAAAKVTLSRGLTGAISDNPMLLLRVTRVVLSIISPLCLDTTASRKSYLWEILPLSNRYFARCEKMKFATKEATMETVLKGNLCFTKSSIIPVSWCICFSIIQPG